MSTHVQADIILIDSDAARALAISESLNVYSNCRVIPSVDKVRAMSFAAAIVIADGESHFIQEQLRILMEFCPPSKIALLSMTPLDANLDIYAAAGVRQFVCAAGPRKERDLAWQVRALLNQDRFLPLEQIFGRFSEARVFLIRDRWERQEAMDQTVEFFVDSDFPDNVLDIQLALDELMNNALYHSFRDARGDEKYSAETFDGVLGGDTVTVQIMRDNDYNVVSVSDNAGTLEPSAVTEHLTRHMNMKGLLDTHGRGFFLMRTVSDGMLIRIQKGVRTDTTLVFGRRNTTLLKSLLVQSIK